MECEIINVVSGLNSNMHYNDEGPLGVIETKWHWGCIAPGLQREVIGGHSGRFEERVQR